MSQIFFSGFSRFSFTLPLKQKTAVAWNFDYYFRHSRMLSSAEPGDLVFFGKTASSDGFEQAVIEVVPGNMFHVAIVKDHQTIIHSASEGVVEASLDDVVSEMQPHFLEVCRVNLPLAVKIHALSFALSSLGAAYNDIFSSKCLNSKGEKAFYCSQLVTEAYAGEEMDFPEHRLQFGSGKTLEYWRKFYNERGREVPLDEKGSHPSQIRRSPRLEQLTVRDFRRMPKNLK